MTRQSSRSKRFQCLIFLSLLTVLGFYLPPVEAHESCCQKKARLLQDDAPEPEFIVDVQATPPSVWEGQALYMDDPSDQRPSYWDDEDDGEWRPRRMLNPDYAWNPPMIRNPKYIPPPTYADQLQVELLAALPWVTLGILVTGILSTCFSTQLLQLPNLLLLQESKSDVVGASRLSMAGSKLIQGTTAALLGLATPLCSCGALPLCAGLMQQGIPMPIAMTFLIASQSAGLDSAAITYGLLGPTAMIGRLVGAVVLAVAVGAACSSAASQSSSPSKTCHTAPSQPSSKTPALTRLLYACSETAVEIYPTVFMGLALSTYCLHVLPSITSYVTSSSDGWTPADMGFRLLVLGSAVPLQLCEHTSVALAAALQKAGASAGLAFAFLLSAPAVNLPTLLLVSSKSINTVSALPGVLGPVVALVTTAMIISYVIDLGGMDLLAGQETGEMATLPTWWVEASPYLAGALLGAGLYQAKLASATKNVEDGRGDCCQPTKIKSN